MGGQLARLHATGRDAPRNRRKVARSPAEVIALLRSSRSDEATVHLADVSTHGCSIKGDVPWLRAGAFVTVGFGDDTMLSAVVRWLRDGSAGMEFLRPIPSECKEWHALINSPLGA